MIGPDGKKIIAVDPALAPIVAQMFERYARGALATRLRIQKFESFRSSHAFPQFETGRRLRIRLPRRSLQRNVVGAIGA
jgi:hypothetical protein